MVFTKKSKMKFLLVFFPNEAQESNTKTQNPIPKSSNLFHKAQSTISICLLLLFTTLLLFTLSTFPSESRRNHYLPRRQYLSMKVNDKFISASSNISFALQRMGTMYRRGTRAMTELVVAHAVESLTLHEFKLFLRMFYMSGITSRSDLLFVFSAKNHGFDNVIMKENESFLKLLSTQFTRKQSDFLFLSCLENHFAKYSVKERESEEAIWGRKIGGNFSEEKENKSIRLSYGSVVSFDVEELDPENSLSGFLDNVPMSLRRWACYPMLLGRVKKHFKHIMLVDMKKYLVLGDQFSRVRSRNSESVLVTAVNHSVLSKRRKKTSSNWKKTVTPGFITGGSKGVRGLSNAMLMDIVRVTMQHKKKNPVLESVLFNQLVGNEFVLKKVKMIKWTESMPDLSTLMGSNSNSDFNLFTSNHTVVRRSNSNSDVYSIIMKHICSLPLYSTVYSDCSPVVNENT